MPNASANILPNISSKIPPNSYPPGTKLTVGSHRIVIKKYLSEGGFAHVYTCSVDPKFGDSETACLKRVVVPNKWQLSLLRQEVDAMRRLRGNKYIVSYIDSHASRIKNGAHNEEFPGINFESPHQQQYEVLLLMEYCEKNGLIDFMNTRLVHKLTEAEILEIMHDVTIGVAMCHHLRPPLIHRDLKIENVLIDREGTFKLADFGSSVNYIPSPKNASELQAVHDDIIHHTTPQYRAPEMIDLTKGFPIDDKSDIWALGCLLYKCCYYTTPFESPKHTSMFDLEQAILNSSSNLKFRDQPGSMFSPRLKNVIRCCLRPDPRRRPNAQQLLQEICSMQGDSVLPDILPLSVKEAKLKNLKTSYSNTMYNGTPETYQAPILKVHSEQRSVPENPPKMTPESAGFTSSSIISSSASPFSSKSADPFADLEKTKYLEVAQKMSRRETDKIKPRPQSAYFSSSQISSSKPLNKFVKDDLSHPYTSSGSNSTHSLKQYVSSQIRGSSNSLNETDLPENEVKDTGTLEFLKSKEEQYNKSSLLDSKQTTGESIKNSIRSGLRKISTGGSTNVSQSAHNTGDSIAKGKRSSFINVFSKRKSSSPESDDVSGIKEQTTPSRKLGIQGRMQLLLDSSKDVSVKKTANGYGKYVDTAHSERDSTPGDDIAAINNEVSRSSNEGGYKSLNNFSHKRKGIHSFPPKVPPSLSLRKNDFKNENIKKGVQENPERDVGVVDKSTQNNKSVPKKPKKPAHLKAHGNHQRRNSNASDVSLPDVDDLEKRFSQRFPSYV